LRITQIEFDPGDPGVLYAGTDRGVFRTTDACMKH
jgi:hypothetical protein